MVQEHDRYWRSVFDAAARTEKEEYSKLFYGSARDEQLQRDLVIMLLGVPPRRQTGRLADVGCGTGRYFRPLVDRGFLVYGCDQSQGMLAQAAKENAACLFQATADKLPYKDSQFDYVISIGVLQTVCDYELALSELVRILRPGGRLVVSTLRVPCLMELAFFPLVMLLMGDQSINCARWYPRLIRDRKGITWPGRRFGSMIRRFHEKDVKQLLTKNGMTGIRRYYLGNFRRIPLLVNSQLVTFKADKPRT